MTRVLISFAYSSMPSLVLHKAGSMHKLGATLDVVIIRADPAFLDCANVVDFGLSDHHLLHWSIVLV
jgi:D-alanyl-D-alanine dipeptidase